jgi:hypothetical protein
MAFSSAVNLTAPCLIVGLAITDVESAMKATGSSSVLRVGDVNTANITLLYPLKRVLKNCSRKIDPDALRIASTCSNCLWM